RSASAGRKKDPSDNQTTSRRSSPRVKIEHQENECRSRGPFFSSLLVLLCYKRRAQQKGQCGSWVRRKRASLIRRVAIEVGLCRSARTRRAAGFEVARKVCGA